MTRQQPSHVLHETPFHVLLHGFTAVLTILILEQHSRLPELAVFLMFFCLFTFPVLFLIWALVVRLAYRSRRWDRHLLGFPIAVALTVSSSATHWPAMLRFEFSRNSFEALIEQANRGDELTGFPRHVGLYWIEEVDDTYNPSTRTGTILFITGTALIDECGLRYDPANPESSGYLNTKISPHWYLAEN